MQRLSFPFPPPWEPTSAKLISIVKNPVGRPSISSLRTVRFYRLAIRPADSFALFAPASNFQANRATLVGRFRLRKKNNGLSPGGRHSDPRPWKPLAGKAFLASCLGCGPNEEGRELSLRKRLHASGKGCGRDCGAGSNREENFPHRASRSRSLPPSSARPWYC